MNPASLISTADAERGFYPTPPELAEKMLKDIDFRFIGTVLEPSAGKGDLVDAMLRAYYLHDKWNRRELDVDLCEIDPQLRAICKYKFCGDRLREIRDKYRDLDNMSRSARTDEQNAEHGRLYAELNTLEKANCHIVHDDFLTYRTYKHYDLILMNPPFANGDEHLLRALELQKTGGMIICLLNAETIRNPYTQRRRILLDQLNKHAAEIRFVEDAFSDAERSAKVDVAIVRVKIEETQEESDIWARMKKAVEAEAIPDPELQALITGDAIEQAVLLYKTEVAATMELVRQYKALTPYMTRKLGAKESFDKTPILTLTVGDDNYVRGFDLNKYMRTVRLKYWKAFFTNKEFTGRLTSELQKRFNETVDRMADYDFSAFNIKQVVLEMNASMTQGVEQAIMELFDKLTYEHSWYPDCANNRHYYNGWATNKAHAVNKKKVIIPTSGMFSSYRWSTESFEVSTAYGVISDIEKAFDYLDGGRTNEIDLLARLRLAAATGKTRNIECKYFDVDIFKKGTTHIKFHKDAAPLVERLNIYASQKKNWLPPSYGRKKYADMAAEERAVVDSFHGDGTDGSGQAAYADVLQNASFYLADPTQAVPALMAAKE